MTPIIQKNSLHSSQPFTEGLHFREVIQVHPQRRVPYSQQLQASMVQFDEVALPKLVQTSTFQASEPALLPCSEIIPSIDLRLDTDQRVEPLFGCAVNSELIELASC
jgi:hypothetical protein